MDKRRDRAVFIGQMIKDPPVAGKCERLSGREISFSHGLGKIAEDERQEQSCAGDTGTTWRSPSGSRADTQPNVKVHLCPRN
jgi:hypothetical protein